MARRRSGNVTVRLAYEDEGAHYRCVLSVAGKRYVTLICPPVSSKLAVDSSFAYDLAARAAINITQYDRVLPGMAPEYDFGPAGNGDLILRRESGKRKMAS